LVYWAVPLSGLHYFLLERDIKDWVFVYAVYVALLFVLRLPAIRQAIARRRQRSQPTVGDTQNEVDSAG